MHKLALRRCLLTICGLLPLHVAADDWAQFLGDNRNALSLESGLIDEWVGDGPELVWHANVGEGMSGCAVAKGKLITVAQDSHDQYAICLDTSDGKELWRTTVSSRYENGQGNGPRATPTIVNDSVFVYSGDGVLAKLDTTDGRIRWKVNVCEEFGGKIAEYGLSCSPLVADDCVVVTMDTNDKQSYGPAVCVSAIDGKLKWRSVASDAPAREEPGYSSPVMMRFGSVDHVVLVSGSRLMGIDLKSGRAVWSEPFETDYACNTASPLVIGESKIFLSAGENHGCALFEVEQGENSSDFKLKEIWTSFGGKSVMRNEWQTSVRDGDYLYGFDNQGSAGAITNLSCINWKTGEQQWLERRFGKGNMIAADGKLWMSTMGGEMVVAKIDPKSYVELGRKKVFDTTRQAPALSDGLLYFRGKESVVCVDAKSSGSE